jgi:hypothetical protein
MAIIGQGVQAGLGRIDYSPYMQGAVAGAQGIAQGLAGFGQSVGSGIQNYLKKQEEKKKEQEGIEFIKNQFPGIDDKAAKAGLNAAGGPAAFVKFQSEQNAMREAAAARNAAMEDQRKAAQVAAYLQQGGGNLPSPVSSSAFTPEQQMAGRAAYTQQARQQAELAKTLAETAKIQLPTAKEAPAGYRYTPQGNLQMIPGGPAEVTATAAAEANRLARESAARQQKELDLRIEAAQAQAKTEAEKKAASEAAVKTAGEDAKLSAETTLREIGKAERLIESPLAQGFGSSIGGFFSGSAANDLETSYDVIRANEALGRIIALKKASPTGSTGFGALNLKELETLQSRFAKLSRSMSDKAAKESLEDLRSVIFRAFPDLKQQSEAKPATKGSRFQVISSS